MSVFVAGQSLASIFLRNGVKHFRHRVAAELPGQPPPHVWGYGAGATVAASTNAFPARLTYGNRFWWDMAASAPGIPLNEALDVIRAGGDSVPSMLVWDQGQHDAVGADGRFGRLPADVARDYRTATVAILRTLRVALLPADPDALPVILMRLGPVRAGDPDLIREQQARIIAEEPNCHDGGDLSGMEVIDGVHPTMRGRRHYAHVLAHSYIRVMSGRNPPRPDT